LGGTEGIVDPAGKAGAMRWVAEEAAFFPARCDYLKMIQI